MDHEWLRFVGKEPLLALVDTAYPITAGQGAKVIQEGEEVSHAFVVEGKKPAGRKQPFNVFVYLFV